MIHFQCDSAEYRDFFCRALRGLEENCRKISEKTGRVLTEGGVYSGIWMECAPLEGVVYAPIAPDVARNNHTAFFHCQREDGQFPSSISENRFCFAQIQQTVPMVETALELARMTNDEELLHQAYHAWEKWDAWIARHRDTKKRNLCEAFCEYDTGHDNSSRFRGLPKSCPERNAALCPDFPTLPYAAPDLTATMYGGRLAMAEIASILGDRVKQDCWIEQAERMRKALFEFCFDHETEFFYDRDAQGNLVRNLSDGGIRVLMEHAVDQALFDRIFSRWILNPEAFWTPYPIPSVAACDPGFQYPPPENCWGGASQALLALRAPRWMEYYGKFSALHHLMLRWLEAMRNAPKFMQQMDPFTGEFSTSPDYSPAMCCALDFTTRLAGVMETSEGLSWGCCGIPGVEHSEFRLDCLRGGSAMLRIRSGGKAELFRNGRKIAEIRGQVRCFSGADGGNLRVAAVSDGSVEVCLRGNEPETFAMQKDQVKLLSRSVPAACVCRALFPTQTMPPSFRCAERRRNDFS